MKITHLYPVGCGLAAVLASGSAPVNAGQPAATATRLMNPKGFINGGAIHLKPAASDPPPPTSIIVDTTLNPLTSGAIAGTPSGGGNLYTVATNYGVTLGNNEFFSFSTFNVGTGDTAQFLAAGNITNIISRVTGGPTSIYGTIISPTSFWFINPAGITIGPGATINVPAGLALATADYISFGDGSKFFALPSSGQTVLSASSPASFGFLGTPASGALTVQSSTLGSTADGSINLTSGGPLTVQGTAISSGPVGSAFGDNGNITIQSLSSVSISDATVNSSGPTSGSLNTVNGGLITIQGSSINIVSSTIEATFDVGANGLGAQFGQGAIVLQATGSASPSGPDLTASVAQPGELRISGSVIDADAGNAQNSNNASPPPGVNWGDILISADDVILNGTSVHAVASGDGRSGNITLNGSLGTWLTGSSIEDTEGASSSGGVISLNGGTLGTSVVDSTLNGTNGNTTGGGVPNTDVVVISAAGGAVDLQNATVITSNVTVPEPEGGFSISSPANGISISGQTIGVHGSTLTSQTVNSADAGNITLTATGAGTNVIQIDGGSVLSSDATLGVTGVSQSSVISLPNAGTITVNAPSGGISISGGSSLSSSAGANAGQAGMISVSGAQVAIDDTQILTTAASTQPAGIQLAGGPGVTFPWVPATISLTASTGGVSISGGTIINAETTGTIDAGSITIQSPAAATGLVSISDAHLSSTSTGGTGNGGQISISGSGVLIAQQSQISSNYSNPGGNPGAPGSVAIFATGASAPNDPLSANLTSATPGVVRIVDSAITATNTGGTGTNNSVTGFGQITIGGDFAGASGTVSDNVVIAGSVASTDVSAGGLGNDLTVEANNSVWIGSSPSGGFGKLAPGNPLGVDDIRNSANQSLITAQTEISAVSGGQILIQGGQGGVTIGDSYVDANNAVDGSNAGTIRSQSNITIDVASTSGAVALSQSAITTETSGVNLAGDIGVTGGSVQIGGGLLSASTTGSGAAGKIAITASAADSSNGAALQVAGGAQITSDASQGQNGTNAGSVTLTAANGSVAVGVSTDSLSAPNIISTSAGATAGQAGIISITGQSLSLTDAKLLTTVDTTNAADGNNVPYVPASVLLTAGGAVTMTNTLIDARTGGAVDAGSVTILGDSVAITGGQQPLAFGGQVLPANTAIFTGTESAGTGGGANITGDGAGGKISIAASASSVSLNDSSVSAQSSAVGNAGSISLASAGTLSITNGSAVQAISEGGNSGTISIGGSGVLIENSSVAADYNYGTIAAGLNAPHGVPGTIAIQATGSNTGAAPQTLIGQVEPGVVQISNNSSVTSTNAGGFDPSGIGGSILIGAAPAAGAGIAVPTGAGTVTDAVVISGSTINNSTSAGGSSADLVVNGTQSVWIGGGSTISSTTGALAFLPGQIFILAGGGLTISQSTVDADNGFIGCLNSTCFSESPTPANITVSSTGGAVDLTKATVSAQTTGVNPAGDIRISGQTVSIDGGKISTSTAGNSIPSESDGNAGNVSIVANGAGAAGAAALLVFGGAQISSDASQGVGGANAGTVTLTASKGAVQVGSPADSLSSPNIISTSAGPNAGQAGIISLTAQDMTLTDAQLLTTIATPNQADAQNFPYLPASVTLTAPGAVNMTNTLIDARTSGAVNAGSVTIRGGSVSVTGGQAPSQFGSGGISLNTDSAIFSGTSSSGNAGAVGITSSSASITIDNASISTISSGPGLAGPVSITAATGLSITGGAVSTQSSEDPKATTKLPTGSAGALTLLAGTALTVSDATITSSYDGTGAVTPPTGNPGYLTLNAPAISILNGSTISTTTTNTDNPSAGQIGIGGVAGFSRYGSPSGTVPASVVIDGSTISVARDNAYESDQGDSSIVIFGNAISIRGGTLIDGSATKDSSSAAVVSVEAFKSLLIDGSTLESTFDGTGAATLATGGAGLVEIAAPAITLQNGTTLSSSATNTTAGPGAVYVGALPGSVSSVVLPAANTIVINDTALDTVSTNAVSLGGIIVNGGAIQITNGSNLNSSAVGQHGSAGEIQITGHTSVTVANSSINSSVQAATASGGATGSAGSIFIGAPTINIGGTSTISTDAALTAGGAGPVTIDDGNSGLSPGSSITMTPGSVLSSNSSGSGSAGRIFLGAGLINLTGTTLSSSTEGSGTAGEIQIIASAADPANGAALVIAGGSALSSDASKGQSTLANAGSVQLLSNNGSVQVGAPTDSKQTAISTSAGESAGTAGGISIVGIGVSLDDADISTTAGGLAASTTRGSIMVASNSATGAGTLSIANSTLDATTNGVQQAGEIDLIGSQVTLGSTNVSSNTTSAGKGGDINIGAADIPVASLAVSGSSTISVDASGSGATAGTGGAINIYSAGPVTLSGAGAKLSSNSSNNASGGAVTIIASSLSMDAGAQVTANTGSSDIAPTPGRTDSTAARLKAPASPSPVVTGGSVLVKTTGDVALTGPDTTISANATGAGSGGTVTITAAGLSLTNGASIATNAIGTGNSGSIFITLTPNAAAAGGPPPVVLSGNSLITTDAKESTGGDIMIDAGGSPLKMNDSTINATAGQAGNGGSILIKNLGQTILQNSGILAEADSGRGGAINLFLEKGALFVEDSQSLVSAQATSGNDGTVTINAPQTNFNSALATPDVSVKRTPELTSNACRRDRNRSTFVREGHGGIAPAPDGYQTTPLPSQATAAPAAQNSPAEKSTPPDARTLVAAAVQVGCE